MEGVSAGDEGDGASDNPWDPILQHAILHWKAEEENSRRLGRRVNLQLTVIAAFLGLGVFRLLDLPGGWSRILIFIGLFFLAVAACQLLALLPKEEEKPKEKKTTKLLARIKRRLPRQIGRFIGRKPRRNPASTKMRFKRDHLALIPDEPEPGTEQFSTYLAFTLVTDAASDLEEQNLIQNDRIDKGQQLIVLGFALIAMAFGVYVVG